MFHYRDMKKLLPFLLITILSNLVAAEISPDPSNDKDTVKYEAEEAAMTGGVVKNKNHPGYSGDGFAANFYNNENGLITFKVEAEQAGKKNLTFRYAAGFGDAKLVLEVNGKKQDIDMMSTESWKVWSHTIVPVELDKGENTISLRMTSRTRDCINLDYLAVGRLLTAEEKAALAAKQAKARAQALSEALSELKEANVNELVLIVRNFINSSHNYTYFNEGFSAGGGLYVFSDKGFKQLIDASQGQILDCELSYDGKKALFSWKKDGRTNYDIFLINIDGTSLKQLTKHRSNDFNASWLPDGDIAFLSDRDNNYAYCMHSSSAVLYRMALDGTKLKRLSANYLSDIAPHVMNDGKIMYCRWEYVDRFQIPCQGLWAQNPDGTGLTHLFGGRLLTPVTISEAKSIPGTNKIIATLTGHNGPICGGIGVIDPSKGAHNPESYKSILGKVVTFKHQAVRNNKQKYEFPYPVNEELFLVSNNGAVELSTYDGKNVVELIGKDDGPATGKLGFYAALPVKTREREPVIQSAIPSNPEPVGKVIMQDVYMGLEDEIAKGNIKRGDIKQIRVVEGLGKTNAGSQRKRAFCWQFPVVSAGATMEPKKTASVVEVEEDGSAMFEVPAMKPVFYQALDAEGRVIHRMRTFTQMMPGEIQSCTGCHMDRNFATPVNTGKRISALQKPIQKLNGAPWKEHKSAFSYPEQIQPIWDKHCISCHNARRQPGGVELSGDRTDLFNVSYDNLVRTGANRNPSQASASSSDFPHTYVSYIPSYNGAEMPYMSEEYFKPKSWGSYKSRLVELLRAGHLDRNGKKRVELSDLEKRTVYAWIDYNVPYYQTSFTNHPDLTHGMRELVPRLYDTILSGVARRRCISCHSTPKETPGWWHWNGHSNPNFKPYQWDRDVRDKNRFIPRKFYLRWEKPELNNFMLAPLAKAAGGTEACGQATFKDKNDPDYQLLFKAFEPIHKRVEKVPRMDMPGAKEVRGNKHSRLYCDQEKP